MTTPPTSAETVETHLNATHSAHRSEKVTMAAVVTAGVVQEFEILKLSFELFHGSGFEWYVRCCEASAQALSQHKNVHCVIFPAIQNARLETDNPAFNRIMEQKMYAIDDAWNKGDCDAVMFMDSDMVVTAPFVQELASLKGEVLLVPHYWPQERIADAGKFGFFNGGFCLTRTRTFHTWWRGAFLSQPHKYTDQQCLDDAPEHFSVAMLGPEANVGFWRSENGTDKLALFRIPDNCKFLHVHLFQPSNTPQQLLCRIFADQYFAFTTNRHLAIEPFKWYQMQSKAFAFQCLAFLKSSNVRQHQHLYREILSRDRLNLYSAVLEPQPAQMLPSN